MTDFMRSAMLLCLLWGLCACTPHIHPLPQPKPAVATAKEGALSKKAQVAQCVRGCKQRLVACNSGCRNHCKQCKAYVNAQALKGYAHYAHEKAVEGGIIARQLNSYKDPLQCSKTTCSCPADYQICVQSCGGVIHKIWSAPPMCG